ncbi:MAG: 6-phosphogluconolactonase [Rickettsiales bacterium]|nr:6-phosphogluconolactonase [Rickettsiales bacterium]
MSHAAHALNTTAPNVRLLRFADRTAFANAIAAQVAQDVTADIARRGVATLVVSGGTTPGEFFKALHAYDLPWDKIHISLADDRWLPITHPDSSEKLVRETLLHPQSPFIGLINEAATPQAGEAQTNERLKALPRPFTVTVLGMGEDGHCASLFPNNAALKNAFNPDYPLLCTAVNDAPKPPPERFTMTYTQLIATGRVVIHLLGKSKIEALEQHVMQDGPVEDMPVRAFLRQTQVPVDIYYAD